MEANEISRLNQVSRRMVRELDILAMNEEWDPRMVAEGHALVEIGRGENITITKLSSLLLLSVSATSRLIKYMLKFKKVEWHKGEDKREKILKLTETGKLELEAVYNLEEDRAYQTLNFLTTADLQQITDSIEKYAEALEKARRLTQRFKFNKLVSSKVISKLVIDMIEDIQINEYNLPIKPDENKCISRIKDEFYFNNSYNFWYLTDDDSTIIASAGLKKINDHQAEVKKFFVKKTHRDFISQNIVNHLSYYANIYGLKELYLGSPTLMKEFYEKAGFENIPASELPSNFERNSLDTEFFRKMVV